MQRSTQVPSKKDWQPVSKVHGIASSRCGDCGAAIKVWASHWAPLIRCASCAYNHWCAAWIH